MSQDAEWPTPKRQFLAAGASDGTMPKQKVLKVHLNDVTPTNETFRQKGAALDALSVCPTPTTFL